MRLAVIPSAEMAESTVQRNAICCNAAISAFETGGEWQSALGLLDRWGASAVQRGTVTCTTAASAFEKAGGLRLALSLYAVTAVGEVQQGAVG